MTAACKLPCSPRRGRCGHYDTKFQDRDHLMCERGPLERKFQHPLSELSGTTVVDCHLQDHSRNRLGTPALTLKHPVTSWCLQDGKGAAIFCFLGTDSSRAGDMVKGQMKWVCSC